jgi:5S rRNA maturation endonuclease (ribonuclease M5)
MLEDIDIKAFLDHYDISYRERGKNVGRGEVNLEVCPFCGDSSFHCCTSLSKPVFHCWVCDEKGSVIRLLREMEIFKGKKIGQITKPFVQEGISEHLESSNRPATKSGGENRQFLTFPKGTLDYLPLPHFNYLQNRGFDPDFLAKKYKLRAVYNTGEQKYRFRIIVPVFINGKAVSFVGASCVQTEGIVKYLNCSPEEAVVPVNNCLYNYDTIERVAVIVEGITDVWNCGDGFIATFRKAMTSEQVELLTRKKPLLERVIIMYDPDARKQTRELSDRLCGLFPVVESWEIMSDEDPGSMKPEEVADLRREIFS